MFHHRQREKDPVGVVVKRSDTARPDVSSRKLTGTWYRVFPSTQRECLALQMLEHRQEKFAPFTAARDINGHGVLISASALAKLDAI
jgi:hypothetical protein